jgi:hypothetical protein
VRSTPIRDAPMRWPPARDTPSCRNCCHSRNCTELAAPNHPANPPTILMQLPKSVAADCQAFKIRVHNRKEHRFFSWFSRYHRLFKICLQPLLRYRQAYLSSFPCTTRKWRLRLPMLTNFLPQMLHSGQGPPPEVDLVH